MLKLWKIVRRITYLPKRLFDKLYDIADNNRQVFDFFDKNLSDIVSKYNAGDSLQSDHQLDTDEKNHGIIWTAWMQGENNAPDCVKRCIASMRRNCNNHEVVVLTEDNWRKYVTLPETIVEKYKSGNMVTAHFADILRLACLRSWGVMA